MVVARLDLSQPEIAAVPVFDLLGLDRDVITGPPSPLVEPQRAALTRQLKDHSDAPRPSRGGRSRRGRSAPTGVSLPPHTGRLVWKSRQGWTDGEHQGVKRFDIGSRRLVTVAASISVTNNDTSER